MKSLLFPVSIAALLVGGAAFAQSDRELAMRAELIQRAEAARSANDHGGALALAKKAAAIRVTPSLRLFLAQEEQATGALADAYGSAKVCTIEAQRDATLRNRGDIIAECQAIESALEKKVGRLVVHITPSAPEGLKVTVGGAELNSALLGTPYIVTPGKILVEASAPHFVASKVEVDVGVGQSVDQELRLQPIPVVTCAEGQIQGDDGRCVTPAVCAAGMVATADRVHCCWAQQTWDAAREACSGAPLCPTGLVVKGESCVTGEAAPAPAAQGKKSIVPLVVAGGGLVVVGAGIVSWLVADSKYSDLKTQCSEPSTCSQHAYQDARGPIQTFDALAVTGFVVGGVVLAGGLTWYVLSPPKTESGATGRLSVSPFHRGLRLVTSF